VISWLSGRVLASELGSLTLDVGGVGYLVHVPDRVVERVSAGSTMQLHTYLHVRDSELTLYGAEDRETMRWFQLLLGVNGVGPRLALAVLSTYSPQDLASRIETGDVDALVKVPGVGRKTAQRILLDVRGQVAVDDFAPADAADDALLALTGLGYTPAEAHAALREVGADSPVEERIRAALQLLGSAPA
jgi:Holliday junction DNA helicase RuvA